MYCPLLSRTKNVECLREECAWWVDLREQGDIRYEECCDDIEPCCAIKCLGEANR